MSKPHDAMRLLAFLTILFILAGGISACKDDPVTPKPGGKDSCDTCICDTCDTTDTVVVTPNDTTSHDFVWTEYNLPGEASINGCWVFDDTTIWVLGNDHYKLRRDGTWARVSNVGSGTMVFGFTPQDSWFHAGTIAWHYKNEKKIEYRLYQDGLGILHYPEDGSLRAAWGTSSNDMFFVGDKGTIVHFDGTNWMKFTKVTEKNLRSVWGTSSDDVWAAGFNSSTDESVLLHFDGSTWTEDPLSVSEGTRRYGIGTVWTCDSAGHKITVLSGATVVRNTDGGAWRSDSGKISNALSSGGFVGIGVKGNSANDLLAAGGWGFIAHWNGKDWHQYKEFFEPGNPLYGASTFSIKGNTAVVAGSKNGSWIAIGRRAK